MLNDDAEDASWPSIAAVPLHLNHHPFHCRRGLPSTGKLRVAWRILWILRWRVGNFITLPGQHSVGMGNVVVGKEGGGWMDWVVVLRVVVVGYRGAVSVLGDRR